MDMATGLQYVHHEYEPTVLHCNIKAGNIMMDSTFRGRLGDFGLACTVDIGKNSYIFKEVFGEHKDSWHMYIVGGLQERQTSMHLECSSLRL
jgi:interleukin-1 receptor-associated kinase 1